MAARAARAARAAPLAQGWSAIARPKEQALGSLIAPVNTRAVRVVRRVATSADAVTFWLAEPGTTLAPAPYLPGQFITLAVPVGNELLYRSYSLCGSGRADAPWEITVKRAGVVSNALCERVGPGTTLYSSPPRGTFTLPYRLDPGVPLTFVAAGSGITPIYGMLRTLAGLPAIMRPPVQLHYASRNLEETIFGRELTELDPRGEWLRCWQYCSSRGQRMTPETVRKRASVAAARTEWYICAPEKLKRDMLLMLHDEGAPLSRVHLEVFASPKRRALALSMPLAMEFVQAEAPSVSIEGQRGALDAGPDESLLETLERHGYRPKFGCRAGVCGACRMQVLCGRVTEDCDSALSPQERAAGYVLGCTAQPLGPVTLAATCAPALAPTGMRGASTGTRTPRRGGKLALRIATLAATLGIFCGAWTLTGTQPAPPTTHQVTPVVTSSAAPSPVQTHDASPGVSVGAGHGGTVPGATRKAQSR